jgi:hypothetical protein
MTVDSGLDNGIPPVLPDTPQLRSYLRFKGWQELPPGPAGSLWANREQTRVDPNQVFSGTIVQLRHEDSLDPFAEIAVSTVRRGRQSEVLVRLSMAQYEQAWEWHYQGRAVLVEGVIRRAPGQRLRVDKPSRIHPVDEMFLTDPGDQ